MADTSTLPQKGLTFEDVWAAIMKTQAQMDETSKKMGYLDNRLVSW